MRFPRAFVLSIAATAIPLVSTATSTAHAAVWSQVSVPQSSSAEVLTAITRVPGSTQLFAVGDSGGPAPVILRMSSGKWATVSGPTPPTPGGPLTRVTALTASDVWAAGFIGDGASTARNLVEHWNGTTWSIVPTPSTGAPLNLPSGLVVFSPTNVWLAGTSMGPSTPARPYVYHYNGSGWKLARPPVPSSASAFFAGINRVPGSNDLVAVGYFEGSGKSESALIERCHKGKWSIQSAANSSDPITQLDSVAAVSGSNLWAVGSSTPDGESQVPFAEHWSGTKWTAVPPRVVSGGELTSVTVVPGTAQIWAVGSAFSGSGSFSAFSQEWTGSSWQTVSMVNPTPITQANGVTADGNADVWSVGSDSASNEQSSAPLVEHFH